MFMLRTCSISTAPSPFAVGRCSKSSFTPCKLDNSSCITLPTAIHGLVRFLCSVRPQLTTARNDLEQVLRIDLRSNSPLPQTLRRFSKYSLLALAFISFNLFAEEKGPNLGKPASVKLIKQWNIDIFPNGKGLPKGQGTVSSGKKVYIQYCLSCHGQQGTGNSADELAGASHSLTDNPPDKTIGTYWPYATTLFDFTRRSMPLNTPGILSDDEVYAVTAYLLYLNKIIDKNDIINTTTLPKIKMPNRKGFINIYKLEEKKQHD